MILINYLAIEAGYTYFQKTDIKFAGQKIGDIETQAADLVAKISVPLVDNFGLYAKAGPGSLHNKGTDVAGGSGSTNNVDLIFA